MSFRILFCLILFIGLSNCKETPNPKSLPNVILILVDDMGYSDLGSYGSEVATPNIDRLAFEGVRFTNAYN
ncbi:MAG: sulfatase-like hydrolase/transferase, partial [Flavobacteriaceae bacterium]